MPIGIVAVGSLSKPMQALAGDYEKRLSRFDTLSIQAIREEKEPEPPSEPLVRKAVEREGERLLKLIKPGDHLIALCIEGPQMSSEAFADRLQSLLVSGKRPVFVIGGSNGLSPDVLARADERLSFSGMTFPHQLARVMLLEQLYRAHKILAHERYHK